MELERLTIADRLEIASFRCMAPPMRPWERPVQELIDDWLPYAPAHGAIQVYGLRDPRLGLVGIAVLHPHADGPGVWRSPLVAITVGQQHRGRGATLKTLVAEQAREQGAAVLVSKVHRDNHAAIRMNESLGAVVQIDDDDPRREHLLCLLVLAGITPPSN